MNELSPTFFTPFFCFGETTADVSCGQESRGFPLLPHSRHWWENASVPLHLFWVSSNSLRLSITTSPRRVATKPHDFTDASLLHMNKRENKGILPVAAFAAADSHVYLLPQWLLPSRSHYLWWQSVSGFMIYFSLGVCNTIFFLLLMKQYLQFFFLLSFLFWCSGFFSTLWHFYQLAVLYKQLIHSVIICGSAILYRFKMSKH